MRRFSALLITLILLAAACGGDADETGDAQGQDGTEESSSTTSTTTSTSTSTTTSTTSTTTTSEPAPPEPAWVAHETGPECKCADGSDFWIHSRTADPERVVLYFQGGGACFTEEMCNFTDGTYKVTTGPDDYPSGATGIFDFENPANPLREWSMVFVPYCTGDVHIGNNTTTYGDLVVEHNGFVNASHGLDFVVDNFPGAAQVLVTGSSAGGVPSPLFGGLMSDALPDADITVLADASGGYPSNPPVNQAIGALWGTQNNIPDWPVLADADPAEFGIPDLFRFAGRHDPDIRMARFDNAYDSTQRNFAALAGIGGDLLDLLRLNESYVEDDGVNLDVYIAPGEDHTILGRDAVYELEVEGVAFIDWLTVLVEGGSPGDVECTECGAPTPSG